MDDKNKLQILYMTNLALSESQHETHDKLKLENWNITKKNYFKRIGQNLESSNSGVTNCLCLARTSGLLGFRTSSVKTHKTHKNPVHTQSQPGTITILGCLKGHEKGMVARIQRGKLFGDHESCGIWKWSKTQPTDTHRKKARKIKTQLTLIMLPHLLLVPPMDLTRRYGQRRLLDVVTWVSLGGRKGKIREMAAAAGLSLKSWALKIKEGGHSTRNTGGL